MAHIAILGAGEFGQALGFLLKKAKHTIEFWDVDTNKTNHDKPMNDVVMQADFVFFAVPSWCLRDCIQGALLALKNDAVLVSVAKGLEKETFATTDTIFQEEIGEQFPVVYLSGPMLAEEIVENKPTGAVLASSNMQHAENVAAIFHGTGLRTELSDDVHGVVLAGVLKNVYTIALGMASALKLGDNARGYIISQALSEMEQMIVKLGGHEHTIYGPAGVGDFVATSSGMYSKNFTYGYTFVTEPEKCNASEGAASYVSLQKLLDSRDGQYPLLEGIIQVLEGSQKPELFFTNYFNE